ncbi:MAG: SemiSWEET transporter [Flaviramulus sp.]|nr:SemiSWEET transporter [Flaviramulus sp.]
MEIIGFISAILTTTAFLPQVYKTWKTKDVSILSFPMLLMFFLGIFMWLVYGFLKESPSMIFANAVTLISSFILLFFK